MSLTDAHGCATLPCPAYQLGSYRASTSVTTVTTSALQRQFDVLAELQKLLTHTPSVFVSHTQAAFNGELPDFYTLILPGREQLPNHVEMGGAAETFMADTSQSVPAIGAVVSVVPCLPAQMTYAPLEDSFTPCSPSTSSFYSTEKGRDLLFWWAAQECETSLSVSIGTQEPTPGVSGETGNGPTRLAELAVCLDEMPELRTFLLHLIKRQRARVGRRLSRCRITVVPRPRPARRNSTLAALAVSRRYGRRGESDDHALPDHRWTSVIRGESALSC